MPRPRAGALFTKSGGRRLRRAILLAFIAHGYAQRLTVKEISKATGLSVGVIKVWAHDARIRHPRWNRRPEKPPVRKYEPAPISLAGPAWSRKAA